MGVTRESVQCTPPRTGLALGVGGMPDCFLSLLSLGSQEPRTELLGALPIPWPSWWSSGVVVHRLKDAVSRVLCVLQLHYDSQKAMRSGRFAGSLAAWARCQETDWQAAPFFPSAQLGLVLLSCHPPATWIDRLTEGARWRPRLFTMGRLWSWYLSPLKDSLWTLFKLGLLFKIVSQKWSCQPSKQPDCEGGGHYNS